MADNAEHQSSLQTEFMQDERSPDAQTGLNALEALKEEEQQAKIEIRSQISELNRNASRKDVSMRLSGDEELMAENAFPSSSPSPCICLESRAMSMLQVVGQLTAQWSRWRSTSRCYPGRKLRR